MRNKLYYKHEKNVFQCVGFWVIISTLCLHLTITTRFLWILNCYCNYYILQLCFIFFHHGVKNQKGNFYFLSHSSCNCEFISHYEKKNLNFDKLRIKNKQKKLSCGINKFYLPFFFLIRNMLPCANGAGLVWYRLLNPLYYIHTLKLSTLSNKIIQKNKDKAA